MTHTSQKTSVAWHPLWRVLCDGVDGLLLMGFFLLILVSGYCLYDSLYVYTHTLDAMEIARYKPAGNVSDTVITPITDEMVGWITIDGTDIDYPVMQGEDSSVFLNKDPFGRFSLSGSIFMDSRNNPSFDDEYTIIYGHHMAYGKMFGALDSYLNEDYARSHASGILLVGYDGAERRELAVFAVVQASAKERTLFQPGPAEKVMRFLAANDALILYKPTGRIIALTTCAESSVDARILVFCEIIQ